jgi:hypothetical protein
VRRIPLFVGSAVLLSPLLLAGAGQASAATSSLTVTTLGRDGRTAVSNKPQAVNLSTHKVYVLTSGKAKTLPAGSYDVLVDIPDARDGRETVGAVKVTVSGATKKTVDARKGHLVKLSLSSAPSTSGGLKAAYVREDLGNICLSDSSGEVAEVQGSAAGGFLYVLPGDQSALEFAWVSLWEPLHEHGAVYMIAGHHTKGVPNGVTAAYSLSKLAKVEVEGRRGPTASADAGFFLYQRTTDPCDITAPMGEPHGSGTLPFTFTAYVPPGSWQVQEEAGDGIEDDFRTYAAGSKHTLVVNHAVWGPYNELPEVSYGDLSINLVQMFVDSALYSSTASDSNPTAKVSVQLATSGKTLLSKSYTTPYGDATEEINPALPGPGWYTLTESAKRYIPGQSIPSGTLSTQATLNLRFDVTDPQAYAQIPDYLTRFTPAGLSTHEQAKPGSSTTVALTPQRSKPIYAGETQPSDAVAKVQAWYSTNGGSTWHAVSVKHTGTSWSVAVKNPKTGAVSLRSEVTDTHGDTATTTVIRAYGIS